MNVLALIVSKTFIARAVSLEDPASSAVLYQQPEHLAALREVLESEAVLRHSVLVMLQSTEKMAFFSVLLIIVASAFLGFNHRTIPSTVLDGR